MEHQPPHDSQEQPQDNSVFQPNFGNEPINEKEPLNVDEKAKPGIFTLLIGLFLIVRGIMRLNEDGMLEIFGILMVVIGLVSLFMYFRNRF